MLFETIELSIEPSAQLEAGEPYSTVRARIEFESSHVGRAGPIDTDLTVFAYSSLDALENLVQQPDLTSELLGDQMTGREVISVVGEVLFASSLGACGQFPFALAEAARRGTGLRVRLRSSAPMITAQPWEMMFSPNEGNYLALLPRFSLVREPRRIGATPDFGVTRPLRVLLCAAQPSDLGEIKVHEEISAVHSVLSGLGDAVEAHTVDGTYEAVAEALASLGPWHIFHFAGHGDYTPGVGGVLCFERADGARDLYNAPTVASLLGSHQPLRLAVLNACRGAMGPSRNAIDAIAGAIVQQGTPSAITMQFEVTDQAALPFATTFYKALLTNGDVEEALHEARSAVARVPLYDAPALEVPLAVEGLRSMEWATPVLHLNASDSTLFANAEVASAGTGAAAPSTLEHALADLFSQDRVTGAPGAVSGASARLTETKRLHWELRYLAGLTPEEALLRIGKAFESTLQLRKLDVTPNGLRALSGGVFAWAPGERLEATAVATAEGTLAVITSRPHQTALLDQGRNKENLERIAKYLGIVI